MTHHEMRAPCVTRFNETVTRQTVFRLTTFVVPSLVRPSVLSTSPVIIIASLSFMSTSRNHFASVSLLPACLPFKLTLCGLLCAKPSLFVMCTLYTHYVLGVCTQHTDVTRSIRYESVRCGTGVHSSSSSEWQFVA